MVSIAFTRGVFGILPLLTVLREKGFLGVWTVLSVLRGRVLDVWTVLTVLGRALWVFENF